MFTQICYSNVEIHQVRISGFLQLPKLSTVYGKTVNYSPVRKLGTESWKERDRNGTD